MTGENGGADNCTPTSNNVQRLTERLGYDPTSKAPSATAGVGILKEVYDELQKERVEKAKQQARTLVTKAIEIAQKLDELDRKYKQEKQKADQELGKLLNQIENLEKGIPVQDNQNQQQGGNKQGNEGDQNKS